MSELNRKKIDLTSVDLLTLDRKTPGSLQAKLHYILQNGIESGALPVGGVLPPERALADFFDVSRITVTKILDKLVQDGLVRKEQGRGNFIQNPPIRPTSVAFLAAAPAHPTLFQVLMGMAPILNEARSQLRVMGAFEGFGAEEDLLKLALDEGASGVIVYPESSLNSPSIYHDLRARNVPFVTIDRYYPDLPSDIVTHDDVGAAKQVCGQLFAQGCKTIGILPHREFEVTSVQDRIKGAREAAIEHGLNPESSVKVWREVYKDFHPSRPKETQREKGLRRLQSALSNSQIDGIFAINGDVAERLVSDLSALSDGTADLESLRLGACSHQPLKEYGRYPIVTALESADLLGAAAAGLILKRVLNPNLKHSHITVPMTLALH